MSRVVFMCGPAGAGKTTYARGLESSGMVRLSFDVEMWSRGITTADLLPAVRADIDAALRSRLLSLVAAGSDVVLDFSFWSRHMRNDWRLLLAPTGVVPEVVYLATERDEVLTRLSSRRGSHSDDCVIDASLASQYLDQFEPPTEAEGPLTIIASPATPAH